MSERNIESLLHITVEGSDLKEFAEKMCANAVPLWWESKERRTTWGIHKNYKVHKTKQKQKRFTNTHIDEFLSNMSSVDNGSDDSDGERSDSNIDMLID